MRRSGDGHVAPDRQLLSTSPTRFPSGIYVDPANASHAWVSYSGFNAATPTTPGHVFDVVRGHGAGLGTFTNLNVEARHGDASRRRSARRPAGERHRPRRREERSTSPPTSASCAATTTARRLARHGGHAPLRGHAPRDPALGRVPTCVGRKHSCERLIYAATHSQGIWKMNLRGPGNTNNGPVSEPLVT